MKKNWTGERLETFVYNENMIEHLHRYSLAVPFTRQKTVLDIACGEGYGSNLLAAASEFVFGIDISEETIAEACIKYTSPNISFLAGAADRIPLESASVDVVVSFETLEHHDKHTEMLLEIKRVLKPGGMLIMSSPDKKYYTDETGYVNKFHVKELYAEEFKLLIGRHFKHGVFLNQRFLAGSIVVAEEGTGTMEVHSGSYERLNDIAPFTPVYNLAIASDDVIAPVPDSIFTAADWFNIISDEIGSRYTSSMTWKAGRLVAGPFLFFKRLLQQR